MGNKDRYEEKLLQLEERLEYVNTLIEECEELRTEWEQRMSEAEEAKNAYETLAQILKRQIDDME